jgi:hopanoid-associated phosphorylase
MIVAVTGMLREARIAAGPGVVTVMGNATLLREKLGRAISGGAHGVISFGIAGGLEPSLKAGDCVVAREVVYGTERFLPDAQWTARMIARLPHATLARVVGADAVVAGRSAKAELYRATGALIADMESHIAAKLAAAHRIPFAVLRVVCDTAGEELPEAASVALGSDGRVKLGAVLGSVLKRPRQIPALLRTARDSKTAFAALLRCRDSLGIGLAGPDFA